MTSFPSLPILDPAVLQPHSFLPRKPPPRFTDQYNHHHPSFSLALPSSALWMSLKSQGTCLPNATLLTQLPKQILEKQQYTTTERSNSEAVLLWAPTAPLSPGFLLTSLALPQSPLLTSDQQCLPREHYDKRSLHGMCQPTHKLSGYHGFYNCFCADNYQACPQKWTFPSQWKLPAVLNSIGLWMPDKALASPLTGRAPLLNHCAPNSPLTKQGNLNPNLQEFLSQWNDSHNKSTQSTASFRGSRPPSQVPEIWRATKWAADLLVFE